MSLTATASRHRILRGVSSLLVLVLVIVGVPVLLVALGAYTTTVPSLDQIWSALSEPDRGQLLFGILAAGVWLCWALFTIASARETAAALRRRHAPQLRGLGAFQRPAAALVAGVAALLISTPHPTPTAATPLPAVSTTRTITTPAPTFLNTGLNQGTSTQKPAVSAAATAAGTAPKYTVQRYDTLWKIAQTHLGDPLRYTEIITLNPGKVGPDNRLEIGTLLTLPADATSATAPATAVAGQTKPRDVTVEAGDSLWTIAQDELGDGQQYPQLWQANAGRAEPGGSFTDPDLIKPGWTITVSSAAGPAETPQPTTAADAATTDEPALGPKPTPEQNTETTDATVDPAPKAPALPPTSTPQQAGPGDSASVPAGADAGSPAAAEQDSTSRTSLLYDILGAGAALLAAGTWLALKGHRRRQFRHRRPGHTLNPLPADVAPLERALGGVGPTAAGRVQFLDTALRTILDAIPDAEALPDVLAARLGPEDLHLVLATHHPAPPPPWRESGQGRWVIDRNADLPPWEPPGERDSVAPYPCLVSIGYDDTDGEWLIDLEHIRPLSITGPPERTLDLARYMAAELANNPWSDLLSVTLTGFGEALVEANPDRLDYQSSMAEAVRSTHAAATDNAEVLTATGLPSSVEGRHRFIAGDVWTPRILLAAPDASDDQDGAAALRDLVTRMSSQTTRTAVAVVVAGGEATDTVPSPWTIQISDDGSARIDALALDFTAHRLPEWAAADIARAIALAMVDRYDSPSGPSEGDRPVDAFTTTLGSLRAEHTVLRPAQTVTVASEDAPSSVLPQPVSIYLSATSATAADVTALGPAVTPSVRRSVQDADPTLDADVAAWHDQDTRRPRLQILGPVRLRASGRPPSKQADQVAELTTYLALRPRGVSSDRLAMEMWPDKNYTGRAQYPRNIISSARTWLGEDENNQPYFPPANRTGAGTYRLRDDVLLDADLFRRLRTRGEARGSDGIADLLTALDLVSGQPFDRRKPGRWAWLTADEEYTYTAMIVEVAHVVATRALAEDDPETARHAAAVALSTDSADDSALLNLMAADLQQGRTAAAQATFQRILMNNDAQVQEDLPKATNEVLQRLQNAFKAS